MGSYSAPSFGLGYYKTEQDVTTADGILQTHIKCVGFYIVFKRSTLWDGVLIAQLQREDDTWFDFYAYDNTIPSPSRPAGDAYLLSVIAANDLKYPYEVRIYSDTQPSLGVCLAYLITTPAPANPLF